MTDDNGIPDPLAPRDLDERGPHHAGEVLDINSAPEDWLARLPELGPAGAAAICAHRPFRDWSELERLDGFDGDAVARLKAGRAELRQS